MMQTPEMRTARCLPEWSKTLEIRIPSCTLCFTRSVHWGILMTTITNVRQHHFYTVQVSFSSIFFSRFVVFSFWKNRQLLLKDLKLCCYCSNWKDMPGWQTANYAVPSQKTLNRFVGIVALSYLVFMTKCHNSHKHSESSLTMFVGVAGNGRSRVNVIAFAFSLKLFCTCLASPTSFWLYIFERVANCLIQLFSHYN